MKNLSNEKLILIKKSIGLGCSILCGLLMFLNFITYTSSSSLASGSSITWDDKVSLFNFLFNGDLIVLDARVNVLRDVFTFSYVVMWISFILCLVSVVILTVGVFINKSFFSKLGSSLLLGGLLILSVISFDKYKIGNTIRHLNVFGLGYIFIILVSIVGLSCTFTLDDKSNNKI